MEDTSEIVSADLSRIGLSRLAILTGITFSGIAIYTVVWQLKARTTLRLSEGNECEESNVDSWL